MNKNALERAKEFAEKGEWGDAYKICSEWLDNGDVHDEDLLNVEEQIELALLRVKCVIKAIHLDKLYSHIDEDGNLIWTDECNEIVDILDDSIGGLFGSILTDEQNFPEFYEKVNLMAKEHFLWLLDDYINMITDVRDESYKKFEKYSQGYNCLSYIIMCDFFCTADLFEIDVSKYKLENHYSETWSIMGDKLFERSKVILHSILDSTSDFPYFDDSDTVFMYIAADGLVASCYLPSEDVEDKNEITKRISRLKYKINLNCDFLNSIYVTQGQRISLLMDETAREERYNDILAYTKEIQQYESEYSHPPVNKEKFSTFPEKQGGGCYIATAVYGSYDCPEVWTLRRFRDNVLAKKLSGRIFIYLYYAISPTIVKWFGKTEWFKNMWKPILDKKIKKLNLDGLENTPYNDRQW